jgi:hypothetical protein
VSDHQQPKFDRLESAASAEPATSDVAATGEPVAETTGTAGAAAILSPEQEETSPKPDAPRMEAATLETPKLEEPKIETPRLEAPRIDAVTLESPPLAEPGMTVSPGDRAGADAMPGAAAPGKRRIPAMAAVVALAMVAGALGGALATAGLGKSTAAGGTALARNGALEASVARIDADMAALRASLEDIAKAGVANFSRTTERLDTVEKAQADPAAKLARLSEAVEKLRAAQASATAATTRDVTGSVPQPAPAATAPAAPPKPDFARLPTVEGWVLRDVSNGSALIEGRRGMYEVYAGDPVPGLGRVDAIRRQDGRWVVVTTKGLIVAR